MISPTLKFGNLHTDSTNGVFLPTTDSAEDTKGSELSSMDGPSVGNTQYLQKYLKNRMTVRAKAKNEVAKGMEKDFQRMRKIGDGRRRRILSPGREKHYQ